jgi:hypothetical protein
VFAALGSFLHNAPHLLSLYAPSEDALLQWANQHGRLIDVDGSSTSMYVLSKHFVIDNPLRPVHDNPHHKEREQFYRRVKADPWLFWRNEQKELSYTTMLWEMLTKQDPRLNRIIMWAHEGQRVYVYKIKKELLDEIDFERFRTDESYLLEHTITRELLFDVRARTERDMWMTHYCRYPDVVNAASAYI